MGKGGGFKSATPSFGQMQVNQRNLQTQHEADMLGQRNQYEAQIKKMQTSPGYIELAQTEQEKRAGVQPPGFQDIRDLQTGELLDQYKVDPFSGKASQQLRDEAFSDAPSRWNKVALGQQGFEESQARGNVGLQGQQAQSQAQSNLMRLGGLGGGARTSLARSGARDQLMAGQQVGSQGILARYGLNQQEAQRKQTLLGQNADLERQGGLANLQSKKDALAARQAFDQNRYNQQMQAWAAKQTAAAMG